MKADLLEDGTITVSGTIRSERFGRIWAGIGWPDLEPGYLCVVGERVDGRYHALWEKRGGLWEIGRAAVEAKEQFLIDRIVVDARDELATAYLRTLPGLCFNEENPEERVRASAFLSTAGAFIRDEGLMATVVGVSERVVMNYRSALDKTRGIIMAGRLLVHEPHCPALLYALRQPLEDLLRSPVMKGVVWIVTALEDARGHETVDEGTCDPWYTNMFRDPG